jgi:hypothetical protein
MDEETKTRKTRTTMVHATQKMNESTRSETAIDGLFDVARTWAHYGLTVGKTALEASAKTLITTASALSDLSEKFKVEPQTPAEERREQADEVGATAQPDRQ